MSAAARGPLFVDLVGLEATAEDREILEHPMIGGVVLFTRNFEDRDQLKALVRAIKRVRGRDLVVAVDHEGGRVQRFRGGGFALLPPAALFGRTSDHDRAAAAGLATRAGWLLATDLATVGVDVSFAPVVDCHHPDSAVLGDRALHRDPQRVAELARAFLVGMHAGGVAGCIKHFPGHGGVSEDSHNELPEDGRPLAELEARDLVAFSELADAESVMTAHVRFPAITGEIPAFSEFWLKTMLRRRLGADGVVVSDDLSMAGAALIEPRAEDRVSRALAAGCDIVLLLNDRPSVVQVLDARRSFRSPPESVWRRWARPVLDARRQPSPAALAAIDRAAVADEVARRLESPG